MKCPKCGFITSELKKQCMRCGSPLPGKGEEPKPSMSPDPPPVAAPTPTGSEVPEWRKQVTQKVREFGERKKLLTTPPGPLRETPATDPLPAPAVEASPVPTPVPRPVPAFAHPQVLPPSSEGRPPAESTPRQTVPSLEVSVEDLIDYEEEVSEEGVPEPPPFLLLRRGFSLLIDSTLLVVLHAALIYLVSQIISYSFTELIGAAWLPLGSIFLLFHFVYYSYFYKTSRQTPGQVFFGIELRDPFSSRISLGKITVRWLCLVTLNIFNLAPLIAGRPMLLDQLSRTEIRTLR